MSTSPDACARIFLLSHMRAYTLLAGIKILVALAQPAPTIRSIVHLFRQKPDPDLYASPVEAANYYVDRVRALADFCRTTDWPYTYFDAELFVRAPERLLPRPTPCLEQALPLTET